jgi:osmoprotectant transport system ATP-binding protein
VEDFVGADRALKHLALHRVADAPLDAAPADPPGDLPRVAGAASLRDALSAMIAAGGERVLVTDAAGEVVGLLTVDAIRARTRAEDRALGPAAQGVGP